MADEAVLAVQNWLNKTYTGIPGFEPAPTDGHTGWATIYALREALQHELGISSIGEGFGTATRTALSGVVDQLKPGYKGNIAQCSSIATVAKCRVQHLSRYYAL